MRTRLRIVALFGVLAAGCGLSVVGTLAGGDGADAGVDATLPPEASLPETGDGGNNEPVPIPPMDDAETPLDPLDAGDDLDATLDAGDDADAAMPLLFQIVAPAGGKYTIYPPGTPMPCSVGGGGAASFRVENTSGETVAVRWYDYQCKEQNYGTVSTGNAKNQPTYVGHRWRIRGADGGLLGDFVLDAPNPDSARYRVLVR